MAATARKIVNAGTRGEWICPDGKAWRVKVPTQNGQKLFTFEEHGGNYKALMAARKFHEKMYNQLRRDRKHLAETGSKNQRETIYMTNKSGHRGVALYVSPRLEGPPCITYVASWSIRGRVYHKGFSTVAHGTKSKALELAIDYRKKMTRKYKN